MKLASLPKITKGRKLAPFELFPDAILFGIHANITTQLQIGFSMNPAELTRIVHGWGIGIFDFTSGKTHATAYDNNR
jgi:hypothetical protein